MTVTARAWVKLKVGDRKSTWASHMVWGPTVPAAIQGPYQKGAGLRSRAWTEAQALVIVKSPHLEPLNSWCLPAKDRRIQVSLVATSNHSVMRVAEVETQKGRSMTTAHHTELPCHLSAQNSFLFKEFQACWGPLFQGASYCFRCSHLISQNFLTS